MGGQACVFYGAAEFSRDTDLAILAGLVYLLQRRWRNLQLRYISLFTDYFALFLLLGIAISGIWMRYFARVDVIAVKQLVLGLAVFAPVVPKQHSCLLFMHLGLVSTLAAYLPFSKLAHMASLPLSPTRNMFGAGRMVHHENPWNYPVSGHTYEEYENEYRGKMKAAGIPVDKEAP